MYLNVEQKKLVQGKPGGHSLIKGVAGSGKTTVAVHRIPFLLNNYCFADDDRILLVTYNKTLVNYIDYLYKKVEVEEQDFGNLFTPNNNKVDINTIDGLIFRYFNAYKKSHKLKLEINFDNNVKYQTIANCIAELQKKYPQVRVLEQRYASFLLDEIDWLKSCNYIELEEYQNADRLGRMGKQGAEGPQRLNKNSDTRQAIFELMQVYDARLRTAGFIDMKDAALIALEQVQRRIDRNYTHILIDESQDLTRVQLEFLRLLQLDKEYSSITFIADTAQSIYPHAWLVKGRNFTSIGMDMTGKSNSLSKNYRTTTQIALAAYSLLEADENIVQDENYVEPSLIDRQGSFPIYRSFKTAKDETQYLIKELHQNLLAKYSPKDIVVIAKSRSQLLYVKEGLDKAGIPSILLGRDEADFEGQSIKLLTMHSIKGLEFKVVLIIGLNSDVIPFNKYRDLEDQNILETADRKLLYVGMTRAHELLYLTSSGAPSKFINDINPQYLKLTAACQISRIYPISLDDFLFKSDIIDLYSAEEKVRQWVIKELLETYKYPLNLINVEYKVNNFSSVGSVDIAVSIYSNNNRIPYIFVETKAPGRGISSGLEQLKSYMSNSATCQYGLVTDGNELVIINKDLELVDDLPCFNASMLPTSIHTYKYLDLKHNRQYAIELDHEDLAEIRVGCDMGKVSYLRNQLVDMPIYSNIAAGTPITISQEVEDYFGLPEEWFKNKDDCFILKVKGDSMIDAEIDDGDYVIIQRQQVAQNREIVAVTIDGDSTLKRFMKMGDSILLIPENQKYEPLQMTSNQVAIIGIAIGILKP